MTAPGYHGDAMHRFFDRLADWQIRHRAWVLLLLVLLTVGSLALLTRLEFNFRPEALQKFSQEEQDFAADFAERFQIRDNILLVVLTADRPGAVLDARGLTLLHELTETVEGSGIAEGVYGLTRIPRKDAAGRMMAFALGRAPRLVEQLPVADGDVEVVRQQVEGSRLIPGQLVSKDGSTAAIIVILRPELGDHSLLDQPLASLQSDLHEQLTREALENGADGAGYRIQFAGLPFVRVETVRNLKSEQRGFWPLTAVVYLILLFAIYRHVGMTFLPLVAVGFASLWGLAVLPLTGTQVNVVNNIVPSLILVIGVCNGVHMLHSYRGARWRGQDPPTAARTMMAELGLPALLTTVTTAIGFTSLITARNETLQQLGWQAGAGIMLSYVALVILLPTFTSLFRNRPLAGRVEDVDGEGWGEARYLDGLVRVTTGRPWTVLLLAIAAFVACVYVGSRVPVDANVIDTFPPGHPIYESNRLVEDELGGIQPLEVGLSGPPGTFFEPDALRQVFTIQQALQGQDNVLTTTSLVDLVAEVHGAVDDEEVRGMLTPERIQFALDTMRRFQPGALQQYVSDDGAHLRLSTRLCACGIQASLGTLASIEEAKAQWLEPLPDGTSLRLTGNAYISARGLDFFIRDLLFSLGTASMVIFLVMVVVFRSLRIGLLSVLPTLLPLALTLGLMPVWGYQLNTSTAVVFCITIGMAVDNTIHILTRFRVLRQEGRDLADAILYTFRHAGAAVVASNVLLIAGFSILFTSDFEPVYRVAALTTTTIAAAMVAAVVVLPALLALFGEPIRGESVRS